jgi:hypothetical protein
MVYYNNVEIIKTDEINGNIVDAKDMISEEEEVFDMVYKCLVNLNG